MAARRCSFKAAADELCVTASAVSHQIKGLEEQLGLALFERGPRSLTLTEAGAHYLEDLDALFSRIESATEQLRKRFSRAVARLQVPPFFASELLVPRLASFSSLHHDIDLQISTDGGPQAAHSPDADLSVVVGVGPWSGVTATRLFAQTYVAVCAPQRWQSAPIRRVSDLANEPLITLGQRPDLWDRWATLQSAGGLHPKQLIRFDTMAAAVHAAEQGVGVALVSAPLASTRIANGRLVRLFDAELATGESYHLLMRPEDGERAALQALTRWLLQQFGSGIE